MDDPAEALPSEDLARHFAERIEAVKARIAGACQRTGRDARQVRLLPISKTRPTPDSYCWPGATGAG